MTSGSGGLDPDDLAGGDSVAWQPIDLLLRQGSPEHVAEMRQQVSQDPMLALQLADTVTLIEQFRHVRTEASPEFAGKLQDVGLHADRFCRSHFEPKSPTWHLPLVAVAAAVATFLALWWADGAEFGSRSRRKLAHVDAIVVPAVGLPAVGLQGSALGRSQDGDVLQSPPAEPWISSEELSWDEAVQEIANRLELETSEHLRNAFRSGIEDVDDPLRQWLDPQNALVLLRIDHELRANAEVRAQALRRRGSLTEVDDRVQVLADGIAKTLLEMSMLAGRVAEDRSSVDMGVGGLESSEQAAATDQQIAEVAWGMRALIGAGSDVTRLTALRRSGDWLARQLPELYGSQLVVALSGLVELAAISGQHFESVAEHGQRLIDEVLQPDDSTWRRRRPDLLAGRVAPGILGEAGRILARLPAFGLDPSHCKIVRRLLLGQLREQRASGQDRPEVLAAMLYGCGDLLEERGREGQSVADAGRTVRSGSSERDRIAWALRRWKPTRLAPDFCTVQQIAWGLSPGSRGFTRLQRELRQVAILPMPTGLQNQAAFCLCLATNYAGFVGSLIPVEQRIRQS